MSKRVLLTGISGYVGLHTANTLLNQGYEVVGVMRSLSKSASVSSTLALSAPTEKLSFQQADLLSNDGWEQAMSGIDYVIHMASPFTLAEPKNEDELIVPAVEGTKRVLNAAIHAGVSRVVLTSSTLAMTAGKPSGHYGPDSWSNVEANIGAYSKSKTLAERAAWEIVKTGDTELVTVCPGFILGPSLGAPGEGQSISMISDLINGKMPMIPNVATGMVDVRDVARLHVAALSADGAAGKRFIAASEKPVPMSQLASVLRNAGYNKVPSRKAPNFAIKMMSLFDREAKGMVPQLGLVQSFDNQATYDILGWQATPLETTFVEMAKVVAK